MKWLVRSFQFELWEVVLDDKDFSLNLFDHDLGHLKKVCSWIKGHQEEI